MQSAELLISGTVCDADGVPLADARVWIAKGPAPTKDVAILTDGEGKFVLSVRAAGDYEVACAADGYQSREVRVHVSPDSGGAADVRLARSP